MSTDFNEKHWFQKQWLHFKELENILHTKECIVCNNKLRDTGIYLTEAGVEMTEEHPDWEKYYSYHLIGCRCCHTIYSSTFDIISMDCNLNRFFA